MERAGEDPSLFEDYNHFYRLCHQRPQDLDIHYKYMAEKPDNYDSLVDYGQFPESGKK